MCLDVCSLPCFVHNSSKPRSSRTTFWFYVVVLTDYFPILKLETSERKGVIEGDCSTEVDAASTHSAVQNIEHYSDAASEAVQTAVSDIQEDAGHPADVEIGMTNGIDATKTENDAKCEKVDNPILAAPTEEVKTDCLDDSDATFDANQEHAEQSAKRKQEENHDVDEVDESKRTKCE